MPKTQSLTDHRKLVEEAPGWALTMPELPRLAHRVLSQAAAHDALHDPIIIERRSRRQLRWLRILSALVAVLIGATLWLVLAKPF